MQQTLEIWVRSLGWEDPLEEEMTTLSSTLAWEIPWTEKPAYLVEKSRTQLSMNMHMCNIYVCMYGCLCVVGGAVYPAMVVKLKYVL